MRAQRWLTFSLMAACIGLSASFAGRAAFWLMYPEAASVPAPEAKAPARKARPAAKPAKPAADLQHMEALNLFGAQLAPNVAFGTDDPGAEAIPDDVVDGLPVSRRGFELVGTIVDAAGSGRAVIAEGGKERTLLEGESVKDWRLVKVMRRVVVLEKDGQRERLPFKEDRKAARNAPRAKAQDSAGTVPLDKGRLAALMRDPSALAVDMTALSSQSQAGRTGLLVGNVASGGLLDLLGLQSGDLLLRGQKKRLARLNDITDLAAELDMSRPVPLELEIMRGGTIILIRYELD